MTDAVSGAILAGGESRRFGSNKALIEIGGERLIDRGIRLMKQWFSPVIVVTRNITEYAGISAILVRDVVSVPGPLTGIYSALLFSPNDWLFVRAVDMPVLTESFVRLLISQISGAVDVIVPVSEQGYEPMCALYRRSCIKAMAEVLEKGGGRIIEFFPKVKVLQVAEDLWRPADSKGMNFYNINTREDLKELLEGGIL